MPRRVLNKRSLGGSYRKNFVLRCQLPLSRSSTVFFTLLSIAGSVHCYVVVTCGNNVKIMRQMGRRLRDLVFHRKGFYIILQFPDREKYVSPQQSGNPA